MARGSRGGRNRGLDWVVNRFTYDPVDPVIISPMTTFALPLTVSDQAKTLELRNGADVGWAAVPEGRGPRTHAVRGHIIFSMVVQETSAMVCLRIAVQTMDFDTLQAVLPTGYSLMEGAPSDAISADEPFAWQEFVSVPHPQLDTTRSVVKVDATVNRRLENNEALYLMFGTAIGAGEVNMWPVLRTLCSIED